MGVIKNLRGCNIGSYGGSFAEGYNIVETSHIALMNNQGRYIKIIIPQNTMTYECEEFDNYFLIYNDFKVDTSVQGHPFGVRFYNYTPSDNNEVFTHVFFLGCMKMPLSRPFLHNRNTPIIIPKKGIRLYIPKYLDDDLPFVSNKVLSQTGDISHFCNILFGNGDLSLVKFKFITDRGVLINQEFSFNLEEFRIDHDKHILFLEVDNNIILTPPPDSGVIKYIRIYEIGYGKILMEIPIENIGIEYIIRSDGNVEVLPFRIALTLPRG